MIGKQFGNYKIVRKLGEGGMGQVYLADDTVLDRQVAIKFLPPRVAEDADALARFKLEAKAAAGLDHPNIVTVHEAGENDGVAYIVMTYVEGHLLTDEIKGGKLSADRSLDIALQILAGLDKAHQANVTHRDIKPDNIAIDTDGNARILDFGLAKLDDVTRLTQENSTVGTLHYMSPEQARGDDVDPRTDLFSVGAMLYEMLTGQRAFPGDHSAAVHYSIANQDPQPMARFNNKITDDYERVVNKLLAKDPDRRYQTARDARTDLLSLREGSNASGSAASASAAGAPGAPKKKTFQFAATIGAIAAIVASLATVTIFKRGDRQPVESTRPLIVVLPFENLGAPDDEYFADGITDEITSRLATIDGLGIISRTSAVAYKNADKTIQQIANELKVTHVLEGTIRWDKSQQPQRVRITPQLISVANDTHLWANNYERPLNSIFSVQADIASEIANALHLTLLESDRELLAKVPTENTDAYAFYLRGLEYVHSGHSMATGQVDTVIDLFERALELDPNFASAWAWLSMMHASTYHNGVDRTEARLKLARETAEKALAIENKSADAHLAMCYYHYWGHKDYDNALVALEKAQEITPGSSEIIQTRGFILRRLGRYDEAVAKLKEALALSPHDRGPLIGLTETYWAMGATDEFVEYAERARALEPDGALMYAYVARFGRDHGDLVRARRALESYPGPKEDLIEDWFFQLLEERKYDEAISLIANASPDEVLSDEGLYAPYSLLRALAYHSKGDTSAANAAARQAKAHFERTIAARPNDHRLYTSLGMTLAMLGEREAAVANATRSVEMYPVERDHFMAPWRLYDAANACALAGDLDAALRFAHELGDVRPFLVESLFSLPWFDPYREDARFKQTIQKYSGETS